MLLAPAAAQAGPLTGAQFMRDPGSSAAQYLRARADPAIARIAAQPTARWFDRQSNRADLAEFVAEARPGELPVVVLYNIPGRDCGSYSAGGARSAADYGRWLNRLLPALAGRRAVVILEPDALAELRCLPRGTQSLLRAAVRRINAMANISLYVDAGHSAWLAPATMAGRLRAVGARRFSLNVSNFNATAREAAYGHRIAGLLGSGSSFVIDTSRNGKGAAPGHQWCNPPGRALGSPPTAATGDPLIDAFLWIKLPGESDGSCHGGPRAGVFWPEYARALSR
ncbi:MAG: glycoside hydrolase family 6 protein [Solirubrobacteraceae bacterium]